ncbi:MAG: peptidyl-prolyl cis-trans isomerase [Phycisphaerae bacterium]|nr:peptidyl-prolyl cis-trans isomerase [Phycisphaerae bacterium]
MRSCIPIADILLLGTSVLLLSAACEMSRTSDRTVTDAWQRNDARFAATQTAEAPAQASPTTRPSADGEEQPAIAQATKPVPPPPPIEPIAFVNGYPIERRAVLDTLIRGYGLNVLQQHILLEVARQAAKRKGIHVSRADIEHEYDETIRSAHLNGNGPETLTSVRRAELIELWLKRTGVSREELDLAMTRQAYLRRLADARVGVDEDDLRAEFQRQYGEKVEIRHIQLRAPRDYDTLRPKIESGADFAGLAALYSQNRVTAPEGGLLPPFSANDERFPATLREAAFKLEPGQVSVPIHYDGEYHVLKLERRVPAQAARFDDVRESLAAAVRARKVAEAMDRLSIELLQQARLRIEDPELRKRYESERAAGRLNGPPLQTSP